MSYRKTTTKKIYIYEKTLTFIQLGWPLISIDKKLGEQLHRQYKCNSGLTITSSLKNAW